MCLCVIPTDGATFSTYILTHLISTPIGKGQLGGNTSVHVVPPPVIAKLGVKFGRGITSWACLTSR